MSFGELYIYFKGYMFIFVIGLWKCRCGCVLKRKGLFLKNWRNFDWIIEGKIYVVKLKNKNIYVIYILVLNITLIYFLE